ncbi:MAG: MFS transporter [Eubacteriales bacterium]|nr:MFS transporter [Eubacteriales bacterium]
METKRKALKLNIIYAMVQGIFWFAYCAAGSFATVFLQSAGYSNTELGLIISAACVFAVIVPTVVSPVIDKSEKLSTSHVVIASLVLQMIIGLLIVFFAQKGFMMSLCYLIFAGIMYMNNAFCTQIAIDHSSEGCRVNYGFSRAFGSFIFVFASAIIGKLLERYSYKVLPLTSVIMQGILILLIIAMAVMDGCMKQKKITDEGTAEKGSGLFEFLRENKYFTILLLGIVILFASFNYVDVYMINLIEDLGGNATDMGYIFSVYAFLEIPAMLLWARFSEGRLATGILMMTFFMFTMRQFVFLFAGNVSTLYFGGIFQFLSYGIYTPAIVDYILKTIPLKDSTKAQSLAGSVTIIGMVLACTIGGYLTDVTSSHSVLSGFSYISIIGTAICVFAVAKTVIRPRN